MKRRIISSILALVMVLSLMIVPSITVSATDPSVFVVVPEGSSFEYDESKLSLLADGVTAEDATSFSDGRFVSFKNTGFEHGVTDPVNGTIEIIRDLGTTKPVNGAAINVFVETNSMIGVPLGVTFYGSADGDCWYNLNAGGKGAIPTVVESAEMAISLTFETRAIFDLRYIKAVVEIDYGWIFASELSVNVVADPAEGSTTNPAGPYALVDAGTSGVRVYTPDDQPEGGFDLSGETKNAQLVKLKATGLEGVYDITYNRLNPWPGGHSGIMTLDEDELLIAVYTGGVLVSGDKFDLASAAKWTLRGMTADDQDDGEGSGDFAYITDDGIYFYPESHPLPTYEAPPAPIGDIISIGKPYTTSTIFRQGGAESGWGWDENAADSYPDEDGKTLTDGVAVPETNEYTDSAWVGFNHGSPDYKENGYSWICIDLEEVTDISKISITFGSTKLGSGSGIGANNLVARFLTSIDGETWTYLGEEAAVDSTEEIAVNVEKETNIPARYVLTTFSRAGWMFVSEVSVYEVAPDPVTLYVNAINDVVNYSPYGKFMDTPSHVGEGTAAIISDPSLLDETYIWRRLVTFAPTDVEGVYEITSIINTGGTNTAPAPLPEGGFMYSIDTGNDWPSLVANNPGVYDAYADYPNCQTPEVLASYSAIDNLEVGMKAELNNINLALSTITDGFESFIIVNGEAEMPYIDGAIDYNDIDLTGKEFVIAEVDSYTYIDLPNQDSWPDAGNALIDGIVPDEVKGPGFSGSTSYTIDFALPEATDVYGLGMWITQMTSWGISAAKDVQFYGTTDGETWTYLGAGYMPEEAEDSDGDGVVDDQQYLYLLELPKYAAGLTGVRVVLDKGVGGWVFASEFEVYTVQDVVVDDPTDPDEPVDPDDPTDPDEPNPPTGEFTQIGFIALAVLLAAAAVVVIKKRRA